MIDIKVILVFLNDLERNNNRDWFHEHTILIEHKHHSIRQIPWLWIGYLIDILRNMINEAYA